MFLRDNSCGHFTHCLQFFSCLWGSKKWYTNRNIYACIVLQNIEYGVFIFQ